MKKIIPFGMLIILFLLPATTLATFTDVPASSWFKEYVDVLADEGIIDQGDFFRPAESLNRAELVKMVIEATHGLEDYQAPAHPTFDDVPPDVWFSPYVEQAATLGIVGGYKDADGSYTGFFGPADPVTRAAATKILAAAFNLEILSSAYRETPSFLDVKEDDWFYMSVLAAYRQAIMDGYSSSRFGPHDPVTRAQIAKMLALSMDPELRVPKVEEEVEEAEEEGSTEETEEEGAVEETMELFTPNPAQIAASVFPPESDEKLVARYHFQGRLEGFLISTLTIVNDTTGNTFGDDPEGSIAIKEVIIKYPNEEGQLKTASSSLSSEGKVRFSNLDFFAKEDEGSVLEIYVLLNSFAEVGENLSGQTFRLGLQNTGNNIQTFKAVGEHSGSTVIFGGNALLLPGSESELFTIRKAVPTLHILEQTNPLIEGSNDLMKYSVTAQRGTVSLARASFEISVTGGFSLSDFKLLSDSGQMEGVNIYDATGAQDLSASGGGSLTSGTSTIIVSFDEAIIISKNDTENYRLKATVTGASSGDSLVTRFSEGDELAPLTGLTATGNENTGKVFVNGDPSAGLFTGATNFSQTAFSDRNFIWSDQSARPHIYPEISGGTVTTESGSADFTNGYLLDLANLDYVLLSK